MEIDHLPPAPYVRGYLKKISAVLQLNHDELWSRYSEELSHNTSGAFDRLPTNRFAIKHLSRKELAAMALAVVLILYFIFNFGQLIGKPKLTILVPSESTTITAEPTILLNGILKQKDKLMINGKEIFIAKDNTFSEPYSLQAGLNAIQF